MKKKFKKLLALLLPATMIAGLLSGFQASASPATSPDRDDSFKMAILPDTQKYARYKNELWLSQTNWIAKNAKKENIMFTAHLGDLVDRADEDYEWRNADKAMKVLDKAKLPYGFFGRKP